MDQPRHSFVVDGPTTTYRDHGSWGGSSSAGMSTIRARSHSPRPLAWGSGLALAATPSPSSPAMTKLIARRFGRPYRSTGSGAVSGSNSFSRGTVRNPASHAYAASVRAHTPRLAFPPLSPDRAPATRPKGARTTGPPGVAATATDGTSARTGGSGGRTGSTTVVSPPMTTCCGSRTAGTAVGQYTPNARAPPVRPSPNMPG